MKECKFIHTLGGYGHWSWTVRLFYCATPIIVFWEMCLFWEPSPRNNCIHILCQELGCNTVITSLLFLFKDLGSSFPRLDLPTNHMNGKRSTNWTVAVTYALRNTKPVHKYHRNNKNLAREKSTQNNLTPHHGGDWHYKCKIVIYMHVLQPTLVTEVLELPYLMNSDLEISKTNGGPESNKNNEPCRTWSKVSLF